MKFIKLVILITILLICFNFLKTIVAPILDNKILNLKGQEKEIPRPDNKKDCLEKNGEWRKPGPWPKEICMLKNKDGGKLCFAGFQCEAGQCISYLKSLRNIPVVALGQCPKYKILFGCLQWVHFGFTDRPVCLD